MTVEYPHLEAAWLRLDAKNGRTILQVDLDLARTGIAALPDSYVPEIECLNVLQFLTAPERIALLNEFYRVLAPKAKVHIQVPYHSHSQAFSHPLIKWPPFSQWSFWFYDRDWREAEPARGVPELTCNFEVGPFSIDYDQTQYERAQNANRPEEWLADATTWFNNVAVYLHVWLTKK